MSIITLLTDFGAQDYFVAAMKGVILSLNPDATIVDITHEIPPQDIQAAAFNLLACYQDFPAGTIHVAVVDPGVGSDRRAILFECANQFFVGPDNGLFSWISEREGKFFAWQITNEQFFQNPVSSTFHGRDVFAPVGAALSRGAAAAEVGPPLKNIVMLAPLLPRATADAIEGSLIHIDRFGNCITNFTSKHINEERIAAGAKLIVNNKEVTSIRRFFADQSAPKNELFLLVGSAGFVEIAAHNASAAGILSAQRGDSVLLVHDGRT
ncbi:MAG: SAM hydrolase/SAM-dependent halogenase family protein [Acidobacteriota bacterium]